MPESINTSVAGLDQPSTPIRVGMLAILLAILVQIGCAARNSAPDITSAPYQGPQLTLNRDGTTALVLMAAPSAGWTIEVDRVVEAFAQRSIFLSVTPPDPKYNYAQVIVEQRVITNVGPESSVRLYARLGRPAGQMSNDKPYSFVGQSTLETVEREILEENAGTANSTNPR